MSKPLALTNGTVYVNLTASGQNLPRSSTKVPARSVVLAFSTKRGTAITLHGQIDTVVKLCGAGPCS